MGHINNFLERARKVLTLNIRSQYSCHAFAERGALLQSDAI